MVDYWFNLRPRQGVPLFKTYVLEVNPYIREAEIWHQETRNIPLSYGAKRSSISWIF